MLRINQLKLPIKQDGNALRAEILRVLKLSSDRLIGYEIIRRSLDARRAEDIHYTYSIDVEIRNEQEYLRRNRNRDITKSTTVEYKAPKRGEELLKQRPVICGSGPAGMFCAYFLAKAGFDPIILERGEPVEKRAGTVEHFWKTGELNPESNVQFGEGGAGTFSDGKLNTMVKDSTGRIRRVLQIFAEHGAPEEIRYLNKPHIGTDELRRVVVNMREEIKRCGGEFYFGAKLTDFHVENGELQSVTWQSADGGHTADTKVLVLAIGHSARDTFEMLYRKGIPMEQKAFAIGVRIEHEQEFISRSQYKAAADILPPADYKVTYTAENGRGIYSFCMCPGGFVVNASSEPGRLTVNGMSNYARDEVNANSALIVTVTPEDFLKATGDSTPLSGVEFQRHYEALAYQTGKGNIPYQLYGDFLAGRPSNGYGRIRPNHKGIGTPANLRECLPGYVTETMLEGMTAFDRLIPGYADEEAVFSGVEMRTSSPVRILRDEACSSAVKGLYPCGEGAGYAGGITSAAVDGLRVYEAIASRYYR